MTTVIDSPTTTLAPVFDGRTRWTAALFVTIGAALQLIEFLLEPAEEKRTRDRIAWWVHHPDRIDYSQAVGTLAIPFLIGGFAVMVALSRRHSRRISAVATVALTFAMTGLAAVHGIELAARGALLAGSSHAASAILDGSRLGAAGGTLLAMFLLGTLVGTLAIYLAMWRSPYVPRVAVVLGLAFVVLDLVVQQYVASHAAALASGLVLAWAILTGYVRPAVAKQQD